MAYRKTDHPGVSTYRRKGLGLYAKWRNPHTLQWQHTSLAEKGYTTRKAAADWLRDKSREIRDGKRKVARDGRSPQISETWPLIENRYIEHFEAEHGAAAASRTRRDWLRHWRDFVLVRRIATGGDLTPQALSSFRDGLASGPRALAPATRNRVLGTTGALLKWAARNGYLLLSRDRIADSLSFFKLDKPKPRVLSRTELIALLRALRDHDRARHFASRRTKSAYPRRTQRATGARIYAPLGTFTILALLTGARPGEVLALKWQEVDFERREIRIWASKTRVERAVPMSDSPLLEAILRHLHARRGSLKHVCGDWDGGRPTEIHDRQWRRLLNMARLDNAPMKTLRSTCVAHVASASQESEYLLEARFGHGAAVSKRHYRQPLHGLADRGKTVEDWLGVASQLRKTARILGLLPRRRSARPSNTP